MNADTLRRIDRALDLLERAIVAYESRPQTARKKRRDEPTGPAPDCPDCDAPMKLRHRKSDGAPFWGCSTFPECTGIVNVDDVGDGGESHGAIFADDNDLPF